MKNKFIFLSVVIIALLMWFFFPSKYDRLMGRVLKEQGEHPEIIIFDGEKEPLFPNEEENNKTIVGVDSNKNGIRDDIDIWINRTAIDSNERMAMRQYAKAQQEWPKLCENNLMNNASKELKDSHDSFNSLKEHSVKEKLDILGLNSKNRLKCHDFYNKKN